MNILHKDQLFKFIRHIYYETLVAEAHYRPNLLYLYYLKICCNDLYTHHNNNNK